MANYRIDLKSRAAKELQRLPKRDYLRLSDKIKTLSQTPRPHGVKKLKKGEEKYRVRVGQYRVLFKIDDKEKRITVYAAGDRKGIYRHL